ncbi:MAG TPA: hypothetical protein DIC34_04640 [Treponema sp.]|nr:MAG: hypothetical protein A2Y36_18645 [Treponema sp. GWA1_62_8]OHE67628.1 MAG: hypothetical protein A2001_19765 [Treponema sp. GWC1_61_84]OHE77145.1 MAG: hypothetical protein A2413_16095 [Treponema sp. RIFOXYC1_FULL_61_9]HCM25824.1 hypothetical protein [Treponema sp.]
MLTIGEFSASTRLTVKTLRMYHEEGIIVPERTDGDNGYRYYGEESWRRAQAVKLLRDVGFSHRELKEILSECTDDEDLGAYLKKRLEAVRQELARMGDVQDRLTFYLETGKETEMKLDREIKDKLIARTTVCSIRYTGRYDGIGQYFATLFKKAGRYTAGPAMAFYHNADYHEDDADIEAAVVVRKEVDLNGIVCRTIPETRVISLLHYGPYDTIGDSYRQLFDAISSRGLKSLLPTRELYLKGPGMIFPRDPKKFVTEIQIPVG